MNSQKSSHNDFLKIKILNPHKKHQRLLNIISKNRINHYHTSQPIPIQLTRQKFDIGTNIQKMQIKKLQELNKNAKMRQTKFMNSYMDKLKKQRKRQERKKMCSNTHINKNFSQTRKSQHQNYGENKNNSNSIYIFLPIVSKAPNQQIIGIGDNKNQSNKAKSPKTLTTIDLFEGRMSKLRKNRTFSMDERISKTSRNFQEESYQLKVQQVIQDIKNNRAKINKQQKNQQNIEKPDQLDIFFKDNVQSSILNTKPNQSMSQNQTNSLSLHKKTNKDRLKYNKFMMLNSKDLQPWGTSKEQDHSQRWINSQVHGIQSFYMI